jgi:hypothetical protein
MIDSGVNPSIAYLSGGFFADLAASVVYEFLPGGRSDGTHLACCGSCSPSRSAGCCAGPATVFRDLPFSALQFAFYEKEQSMAKQWVGKRDIGLGFLPGGRSDGTHLACCGSCSPSRSAGCCVGPATGVHFRRSNSHSTRKSNQWLNNGLANGTLDWD